MQHHVLLVVSLHHPPSWGFDDGTRNLGAQAPRRCPWYLEASDCFAFAARARQLPFVSVGSDFFQKYRKGVCCISVRSPFLCVSGHGEVWDRVAAREGSSAWVRFKILPFKWVLKCERGKKGWPLREVSFR